MLDYAFVSKFRREGDRRSYSVRDSCFYALSIGMGTDPLDEWGLDFVLESRGPRTLPTMASILARSLSHDLGLEMSKVVHAEQRLVCHQPIPPSGELIIDGYVTSIVDKGPGKGAIVSFENAARLAGTDVPLFTLCNTLFARGDGGCGGPTESATPRHRVPEREPDRFHQSSTRPDQALFYRLNGDLNPLHAEPEAAKRAGFPRPILHGLCTYGLACRAMVEAVCDGDSGRILAFDVRFTAPVFPGDSILTEFWIDGAVVSFRCRVPEREATVIDGGRCVLRTG